MKSEIIKICLASTMFVAVAGCTGRVTDSPASESSAIKSMAEQSALSLISNSSQSQPVCATGNTAVLQIALSNLSKFYCRDLSKLMTAAKIGKVCPGGVDIVAFDVNQATVDCSEMTLCGRRASSSEVVALRIDGTPVQQLTFKDLPWGCEARVEASTDPGFDPTQSQVVSLQVLPPTCPFCVSANKVTCESCTAVDPATSKVVAGQVIPLACAGGCKTCANSGNTFQHGDINTFYTTSNAGCGLTCAQTSVPRVCNDGKWVPTPDSSYVSQCQEPAPALCTSAKPSSVSSKAVSSFLSFFKSTIFTAGPGDLATCSSCQSGGCSTCTTSNGSAGYVLYSTTSVPSGSSCSAVSQCSACVGGLFQGDPAYKYASCTALGASCTAKAVAGPVSTGGSQAFFDPAQAICSSRILNCSNGSWYETGGAPVAQATVDTYTLTCVPKTDCTTQGGVLIKDGLTVNVFASEAVNSDQSCYAATNYSRLNCVKGNISPSDPGPAFKYTSCDYKKCADPSDPLGTIRAGTTLKKYKKAMGDCATGDPAADCNAGLVTISCGTTGGTATVTPPTTDYSPYKYTSCTVPVSCSECKVSTRDSGIVGITSGSSVSLYKAATADVCGAIGAKFDCVASTTGGSPTIKSATGAVLSEYQYLKCEAAGADQGSGGGTGGGTGNDAGPGAAIKKKFGASDGAGGGGLGCIDGSRCHLEISAVSQQLAFIPCLLPWGIGEIEYYGSFVGFSATGLTLASGTTDTVCVTKPNRCSNHRQVRTCHNGGLMGAPEFRYPNCVEKVSCP